MAIGSITDLSTAYTYLNTNTGSATNSSIASGSTSSAINADLSNYYIYDENGNYIGIDYTKLAADKLGNDEIKNDKEESENLKMYILQKKSDSFEKQIQENEEIETEEAEEAEAYKSEITLGYQDLCNLFSSKNIYDTLNVDSELNYTRESLDKEMTNIYNQFEKLTKATASNTTVIESVKEFQSKLKEVEEQANIFADDVEAENEEFAFSLTTAEEVYNDKNPITTHTEDTQDDILANNPFLQSVYDTTEAEEEEEFAA